MLQEKNEHGRHVWATRAQWVPEWEDEKELIAQVSGAKAAEIAHFIESNSWDNYPCAAVYAYAPGPNSNTYVMWILEQTGWDAALPARSFGTSYDVQGCAN